MYFLHFWRLEVHNQCTTRFGVTWRPASWFIDVFLFSMSPHIRKGWRSFWAPFIRTLIPFMMASLIWSNHLPEALLPHRGLHFNNINLKQDTYLAYSILLSLWCMAAEILYSVIFLLMVLLQTELHMHS